MSRLKELYSAEIKDAMMKKFGYKNVMQIPKLEKIVINMGVGEARENAKVLDAAVKAGFHAGNVIKQAAAVVGGGGGGRPNMAQAGGKNVAAIDDALTKAVEVVSEQL